MRTSFACILLILFVLPGPVLPQNGPSAASNPLSVGIARNQQELQSLSTLIAENNAEMGTIVRETLVSLAGSIAGMGPESEFGQSPREAIAGLISAYQKLDSAIKTGKDVMDGQAWLAISQQLSLVLDLIGETELPVRCANTLTDLVVKTAQLVSLARQNANLVATKVQVARAQAYLLAKAASMQARLAAVQQIASQNTLLPQINSQSEVFSQWLLQEYKDRPQVIQLTVETAASGGLNRAPQVVSGLQAVGVNQDVFNLAKIPGINPDAVAAMIRCSQIALTMGMRQVNLDQIWQNCPKPANPGDDAPPCPLYEQAATANAGINRQSMTCNKYPDGSYIPFFRSPRKISKTPSGCAGDQPESASVTQVSGRTGLIVKPPASVASSLARVPESMTLSIMRGPCEDYTEPFNPNPKLLSPKVRFAKHLGWLHYFDGRSFDALKPGVYCTGIEINDLGFSAYGFGAANFKVIAGHTAVVTLPMGFLRTTNNGGSGGETPCYIVTSDHKRIGGLSSDNGVHLSLKPPNNQYPLPPGSYSYSCIAPDAYGSRRGTFVITSGQVTTVDVH